MTRLNAITFVEKQQPKAEGHDGTLAMLPAAKSVLVKKVPDSYIDGSLALKQTVAKAPFSRPIASIMRAVLRQKKANFNQIEKQGFTAGDLWLNSGNICDTSYLLLEAGMVFFPAINTIGVSILSSTFGIIGGVQSLGEGVLSIKEGLQALKNDDKKLAARLLFCGLSMILVGSVMILASISSLAAKTGASSGVAAFFAANPWLLSVLFLLTTLPILVEVVSRTSKIWAGTDIGSNLQLKNIKGLLEDKKGEKIKRLLGLLHKVFNLEEYETLNEDQRIEKLSAKMEELQSEIGVKAAQSAFKLIMQITEAHEKSLDVANNSPIIETLTQLQKEIKTWNLIQHVRLLEQLLYVIAFPIGLVALLPTTSACFLGGVCTLALALANGMPGVLDLKFPYERTIPKVVPKAEKEKVKAELDRQEQALLLV